MSTRDTGLQLGSGQPVFVPDLGEVEPAQWHDGAVGVHTVHATDAVGFAVQLVAAGGHLQAHHHEGMWDHFVALRGAATLQLTTREGQRSEHRMTAGAFLAVPPRVTHRVDNTHGDQPFVYLLVQAPFVEGDFHDDQPRRNESGEPT